MEARNEQTGAGADGFELRCLLVGNCVRNYGCLGEILMLRLQRLKVYDCGQFLATSPNLKSLKKNSQ